MSRRIVAHLLVAAMALAALIAATSAAMAQPAATDKPPSAAPPRGARLAPGQQPVGPQPGQPPKAGDMQMPSRERMREMLERARARTGQPPPAEPAATAPAPAPAKAKLYPRDEHGHCLGQGPDDRPKDINLLHGWLGVNNDRAVPAPAAVGSKDWWIWRVTPYPFRYENHDDHCDPGNEPIPLLAGIVNLAALAFLLVRFGRKPLREALAKRKSEITSEIDKARTIRTAAQKRLDRYQDELDHLDDKLVSLREQYAAEGVHDEQRVVEDMKSNRERMLADSDFRLAQEEKVARDQLSQGALQAALGAAETLLVEKVGEQDHQRLADEYLEQIGPALTLSQGGKGLS